MFRLAPLDWQQSRSIYRMLGWGILGRLILALLIPMTNDEAYYWDWGQDPRLSYYDHPPGVSYVTFAGSWIVGLFSNSPFFDSRPWEARFFAPWIFGFGSLFLIKTLLLFTAKSAQQQSSAYGAAKDLAWILILVPGPSLLGCLALPDGGLMATSALALYMTVRLADEKKLGAGVGALYGGCFGLCGLFKYHALLLCGGLAAFLFFYRFLKSRRLAASDYGFWAMVLGAGFLVCLPVWIWNAEHGGASILFQLDHGFGGPKFRLATGGRLLAAQVVILGPWFLMVACRTLLRRRALATPSAPLWSALPLMAIVVVAAFFKEMMPHWLLPAWILLTPLVAYDGIFYKQKNDFKGLNFLKGLWPLTILCLLGLLAHGGLRQGILASLHDDPGPLAEVTLWEPLAKTVEQIRLQQPSRPELSPSGCPSQPLWAGVRWFSVAQLRYHLTGQPKVYSLDPHHNSYYRDRDFKDWPVGCPVWIVAHGPSLDRRRLLEWVDVVEEQPLVVPDHRRVPWVLLIGTFKARPDPA